MKIDMANFQLQAVKPYLLQQSLEYERNKFKQYIQANPGTSFVKNELRIVSLPNNYDRPFHSVRVEGRQSKPVEESCWQFFVMIWDHRLKPHRPYMFGIEFFNLTPKVFLYVLQFSSPH